MSGEEVWNHMSNEDNLNVKSSHIIAQVAHITYKKDKHKILSSTVSDKLSEGYEKLLSHVMVFVKPSSSNAKVKAVMLSKHACGIKLECDPMDPSMIYLTYQISGSGFMMTQHDETRFPASCKVIFTTPPFSLFITGDLSYYANVLGMPNSTSYWCPWCLLSHPEWNKPPETFIAQARTSTFLSETASAVKDGTDKKLKPYDQNGVTCKRHYKCLGQENYAPPCCI
jgi:hypothetical protein